MKQPLVSIVILNWNGLNDTKVCLDYVRKLDYKEKEIVLVDNGSSQKEKDYLAREDGIIFVSNPTNLGFTGGHIKGLEHCSGDFIFLLNNDAVVKSNYITEALKDFDDPNVGIVGGRAYFWDERHAILDENNPFYTYQNIDIHTAEAFMQTTDQGIKQEVNNLSGSAIIVRKSAIDKVGYLYKPFFAYFEETDLASRMKRANYKVLYDPGLHIWHRGGASSGANTGSYFFFYHIFRNRFVFATRNFERSYMFKFWLHFLKTGLLSFIKLLFSKENHTMHKAYFLAFLYCVITSPSLH